MSTEYFVLKDDRDRYYIREGAATTNIDNATKFNSIMDLITSVPIYRDYNYDYSLYKIHEGETIKIPELEWAPLYREWESNNPEKYEALYDRSTINMLRTTYS